VRRVDMPNSERLAASGSSPRLFRPDIQNPLGTEDELSVPPVASWFSNNRNLFLPLQSDEQQARPPLRRRKQGSPLLKLARVLVRFNHVARFIVNANHSVM
jgi:hypothetical protein